MTRSNSQSPGHADILAAALREFADHGFQGARASWWPGRRGTSAWPPARRSCSTGCAPDDALLPVDRPIAVDDLLARDVELAQPATRRDLKRLAELTACPRQAARLLELAGDPEGTPESATSRYEAEVLQQRVSILDLLERFEACALPFEVFLELLPPMKPRRYSISSSPRIDPRRCTLTVAVLDVPAWSGHGRFCGTASSFLARVEPGEAVPAAVRPPHTPFTLPADPSVPVVMIAAGTGIAPFRGFIEDRAEQRRAGVELGPALLFFGCDHPDVDWLYRAQLEAWAREGVVGVYPAFLRAEQDGVTFVQHRVWAERERVGALLDAGARVYVCGDGRHMAPAVRETVGRIHQLRHGLDPARAEAWLRDQEQAHAYVADVFGG